jgi:hypothetical protein
MVTAASGRHSDGLIEFALLGRQTPIFYTVIFASVAAVPLIAKLVRLLRWDRNSRRDRRLSELWSDMTAVCQEVVFLADAGITPGNSRYRLHRTVVEIRDAIMVLSRYASKQHDAVAQQASGKPELQAAVRLVLAWQAKSRGDPPAPDLLAPTSTASDLIDDADELLVLAHNWKVAKSLVAVRNL